MDQTDIIWHDYKQSIELHKSYLELAIKLNMFYYAITGAILSFYFTNTEIQMAKYALGLPVVLSAALAFLFFRSVPLAKNLRAHIKSTSEQLRLPFYPEGIVLVVICQIFGTVLALISIALIFFFFCGSP